MAERRRVTIEARPLTASDWAPFGWLPAEDTDPRDRELTYEFEWGDPHVNVIRHRADEVEHTERGPLCAAMFRHDTHTQTLLVLDASSVIAVAPAVVDFSGPTGLESVRAFRVKPLEALTLLRGTWHWGPFPIDAPVVRLFNVQGKRYAEDNTSVDLVAHTGGVVEVVV